MADSGKDTLHHDVAGEDILARDGERFAEYRRKWEENPARLEQGDFPLHIDLEVTSYCNLSCPFCMTTYNKSRFSNGYMTWETATRILDEGAEHGLAACKFNMRGEPLLHPDLERFVAYAKSKGVLDAFFNTNATLLTEERARGLIEAGLDRLTVSCDNFEAETYERYRVGAKFDVVVRNVTRLMELREEMGSATPKVRVQAVLVPEVAARFDEFVGFWRDKVDQVSYNDMLDNVPKDVPAVPSGWACPFPYQRLEVMWDGTVTVCYNDIFGRLSVGNVHDRSLAECWTEGLADLRRIHREGLAHTIETCRSCPLRMSEMIKRGEMQPLPGE